MLNVIEGFDWDDGNKEKCQKHGLTIEQIEQAFFAPSLLVAPDVKHSQSEQRYIAIAELAGRPAFIAFSLRNRRIRPISARYMHQKEVRKYEKEIAHVKK